MPLKNIAKSALFSEYTQDCFKYFFHRFRSIHRQLFDMRALMGLSIDEITQQTGIAKPSVTAMVSAARKKVFTELKRRMKQ